MPHPDSPLELHRTPSDPTPTPGLVSLRRPLQRMPENVLRVRAEGVANIAREWRARGTPRVQSVALPAQASRWELFSL